MKICEWKENRNLKIDMEKGFYLAAPQDLRAFFSNQIHRFRRLIRIILSTNWH